MSAGQFDLAAHNASDYATSVGPATLAFELCAVLYPGDGTREGKALRVKQQYMLCSASLQDILTRFAERAGGRPNWADLASKVAIQMNDTHPTLAAPELMRLLIDTHGLSYDAAWAITSKAVAYTNHTVMPEALEKWPLELLEELLPRHVELIKQIDARFIATVKKQYSGMAPEALAATLSKMVILENYEHPEAAEKKAVAAAEEEEEAAAPLVSAPPAMVRMANLCVIAGHSVNGVAAIHSEIVKADVFNDFYKLWPHKFQNKVRVLVRESWRRCVLSSPLADQRRHPSPLAGAVQPRPLRGHHAAPGQRRLGGRSGPAGRPGQARRRPRAAGAVGCRQARQQGGPGGLHQGADGRDGEPRRDVGHPGEAHPRVQAPAAQHPGHCLPLQADEGHDPRTARCLRAPRLHGGRQGIRNLPAGQAHCEAGQRGWRGGEQRPRDRRPPQGALHP